MLDLSHISCLVQLCVFIRPRTPPRSTLFPYTTLFRSTRMRTPSYVSTSSSSMLSTVLPDMIERSEEHTSELQSPCNLVCRLLLEKKKTERSQINIRPSNDFLLVTLCAEVSGLTSLVAS